MRHFSFHAEHPFLERSPCGLNETAESVISANGPEKIRHRRPLKPQFMQSHPPKLFKVGNSRV